MTYSIEVVKSYSDLKLTGKLVSCLAPTKSFQNMRAKLARIASELSGELCVRQDSCPLFRVTARDGHIISERSCVPERKKKVLEFDLRHEHGKKVFKVGFVAGDLSQWIKSDPTGKPASVKGCTRKTSSKHYVSFNSGNTLMNLMK